MTVDSPGSHVEQLDRLRCLVADLAQLRRQRDLFRMEYQPALDESARLGQEVRAAEVAVRELAAELFAQIEDRKPTAGVTCAPTRRLSYDPAQAKAWAIERGLYGCLVLDEAAFEKLAQVERPPFVEELAACRVTIASDLQGALAAAAR